MSTSQSVSRPQRSVVSPQTAYLTGRDVWLLRFFRRGLEFYPWDQGQHLLALHRRVADDWGWWRSALPQELVTRLDSLLEELYRHSSALVRDCDPELFDQWDCAWGALETHLAHCVQQLNLSAWYQLGREYAEYVTALNEAPPIANPRDLPPLTWLLQAVNKLPVRARALLSTARRLNSAACDALALVEETLGCDDHDSITEDDCRRRMMAAVMGLEKQLSHQIGDLPESAWGCESSDPTGTGFRPAYLGLELDKSKYVARRHVAGEWRVVDFSKSRLQWRLLEALCTSRESPLSNEAVKERWESLGGQAQFGHNLLDDAYSELRRSLRPLELSVATRRNIGRFLVDSRA